MVYLNIRETGEGGEWLGPPEKSLLTKFNLIQSEFIILQKIEENFGFFFDVIDDDPDEETMDAILRRGEEDVISGMFTEDTARYSSEIDEYVRINAIYVERGHVKIMSLVLQDRIADFFPFQYLQELTELEFLSVSNIEIKYLINLCNLRGLDYTSQQLTVFPEIKPGMFSNLEHLYLQSNELKNVPASFSNLVALRTLDLSNNVLREIPSSVLKLENLEYLALNFNRIRILNLQAAKFSNLWKLLVNSCGVTGVKFIDGGFAKLYWLELRDNRLDHFPDALTMLPSLSWLNLDNNQIVTVSDNVDKLVNLWHLYLSDNSIKYLPESMHQLKNLRSMTLSENDIKNCDMILKILQCTNISSLTWYGNPSRECVTAIHGIVDNLSEEEMIQRSVFSVKFTFDHSNLQLNCKH